MEEEEGARSQEKRPLHEGSEKEKGASTTSTAPHGEGKGPVADLKSELSWFLQTWKKELQQPDTPDKQDGNQQPIGSHVLQSESAKRGDEDGGLSLSFSSGGVSEKLRYIASTERTPLPFVLETEPHFGGSFDLFPEEVLVHILSFLEGAVALARISIVCKKLFMLSREPFLWRLQCYQLWGRNLCKKDSYIKFGGWYKMYMNRPRLRYDGVFISKNMYVRQGTTEWNYYQPVHSVVYYRYLRFFQEDQTVLYCMSLEPPRKVVQYLNHSSLTQKVHAIAQCVNLGTYAWDSVTGATEVWVTTRSQTIQHFITTIGCKLAGSLLYMTVTDYLTSSGGGPETSHFPTSIPIAGFRFFPVTPDKLDPPDRSQA